MRIRRLEPSEHGRTRKLYETVFFQDEARFVDYYYNWKTRNNVIYVAEDEEGIHSMLHLNPYQVNWNGKIETIYYIVAVATEKEYRHQGWMRRLIGQSLQGLYDQKEPFTFLMPASEAIYTPFGFCRAWEWQWEEDVILGKECFSAREVEGKTKERVLEAASVGEAAVCEKYDRNIDFACPASVCSDEQLIQLSHCVNDTFGKKFTLFTHRSLEYYRNLDREQKASGGELEILFKKEDMEEIPVSARCSAKESFPPMMNRILHLESFIHRIRSKGEKIFYWQVEDELLPGNNGMFQITLTPMGGEIFRLSEKDIKIQNMKSVKKVTISEIPELLEKENPFLHTMISEVV